MSVLRSAAILIVAAALLAGCTPTEPTPTPSSTDPATSTATPEPSATETAEPTTGLTSDDRDNIVAAITSDNTAALEGYFSDSVFVVLMASECCGASTPAETVGHLAYVADAPDPWDFALPAATIDTWRTGWYADQFTPEVIAGRAADGTAIVFGIGGAGGDEIVSVLMGHDSIIMG
jgi:hypothetical protein